MAPPARKCQAGWRLGRQEGRSYPGVLLTRGCGAGVLSYLENSKHPSSDLVPEPLIQKTRMALRHLYFEKAA